MLVRALVVTADGEEWRTPDELGLSYRHSSLSSGEVVARVEYRLEARAPDLHLALPRQAFEDVPPPAVEAGGWLFTVRLVPGGIVLNDDRTKHLHLARTA